MEASKKRLILLAIMLVAATTLGAGAQQLGLFSFVDDLTGIIEDDRRVPMPYTLTKLPEFFEASVTVEGSGYTGQPHTINISISHNRPDSSVWLAQGTYSLDLELIAGESFENITSGFFTKLQRTDPYIAQPHPWTPTSPEGNYEMVLNIRDLMWTKGFVITVTTGPNGIISPLGPVTMGEGSDQTFTITPNDGYEIADVLVDGSTVGAVSTYSFIGVNDDHTIEAVFSELVYTYSSTRKILIGEPVSLTGASFNGLDPNTYSAGEMVSFVLDAVWDIGLTTGFNLNSITYDVRVSLVGGTNYLVIENALQTFAGAPGGTIGMGGSFQITGSFPQPPMGIPGDWEIIIVVTART